MFELNKPIYLGDGLYASFDGYHFKLYTERPDGTHEVYLDDSVLKNFLKFVNSFRSPDQRHT